MIMHELKKDNKNAISWFMSRFKTEKLYKCKYKKVLSKEWGENDRFWVRVT
jgi:hypothetical protein